MDITRTDGALPVGSLFPRKAVKMYPNLVVRSRIHVLVFLIFFSAVLCLSSSSNTAIEPGIPDPPGITSTATFSAQLVIHEEDANNVVQRAVELNELGATGVVHQGKEFVFWRPHIDFKPGGSLISISFGQKDVITGEKVFLKRLVLPLEIPEFSVSSAQVDAVIHGIGDALQFLPDPPRNDVEEFFTSYGIPIHKGSILDKARFDIAGNDLAIKARSARISGRLFKEDSVVISAEVYLDIVSRGFKLARKWKGGITFDYAILSDNGVEYQVAALEARIPASANALGQQHSGSSSSTKTFNVSGLKAGSGATASVFDWSGAWNDGDTKWTGTVHYFVGFLQNLNGYIGFYSRVTTFFKPHDNWHYIDLYVNCVVQDSPSTQCPQLEL